MNCSNNNLYIISFLVGAESGLALVAAPDEFTAKQILRNSGSRNCCPDNYDILQCRCLGVGSGSVYGLLMESYVNAIYAYTSIMEVANKFLKGEPGDSVLATMYVDNDLYIHVVENSYVITPHLSYDKSTGYLTLI